MSASEPEPWSTWEDPAPATLVPSPPGHRPVRLSDRGLLIAVALVGVALVVSVILAALTVHSPTMTPVPMATVSQA